MKYKDEIEAQRGSPGIRLRRSRSVLATAGGGVIVFCVWGWVKSALYLMLNPSNEKSPLLFLRGIYTDVKEADVFLVSLLAVVIYLALLAGDVLIRLYVGRSARAESRGEVRGAAYVVLAWILLAEEAASLILYILSLFLSRNDPVTALAGIILEATVLFTFVELLVSARRVRRLRREMAGAGQEEYMSG